MCEYDALNEKLLTQHIRDRHGLVSIASKIKLFTHDKEIQ